MAFHEVRFPLDVSLRASGGPERRTDVVTMASGHEERNQRWAHSRRRYDAGYGVKSFATLAAIIAFFEERRGRLHGFRFRDRLDWSSALPGAAILPGDQFLGNGTGTRSTFQLVKRYGGQHAPYVRSIVKPVAGSVRIAVAGIEKVAGTDFTVDSTTGLVTFQAGHLPGAGQAVTAGFAYDVPVRFDSDMLDIDIEAFEAGAIPKIPLVEILI
ncbi:MAG TPA: DUF2460 domain-containing protein [Beijerinckiaceae bacterium]|nr:DUF2460 domain-containing protein [Beijerinckiaceae bacterium]